MAAVQKAKEVAAILMRLAGIRDHAWSAKGASISIEASTPISAPAFQINIVPSNYRPGITIDADPDLHDPDR
jgi:hypothetical protein